MMCIFPHKEPTINNGHGTEEIGYGVSVELCNVFTGDLLSTILSAIFGKLGTIFCIL